MHNTGTLIRWNDARGVGFIAGAGGELVFVHIIAFPFGSRRPSLREAISYERAIGARQRPYARRATFVSTKNAIRMPRAALTHTGSTATAINLLLICGWALAAAAGKLAHALPLLYALASAAAFTAYAIDKSAARRGRPRLPENTLHVVSLLGGWPGALAARRLLRHKLRKPSFRRMFRFTLLLHGGLLGCLLFFFA